MRLRPTHAVAASAAVLGLLIAGPAIAGAGGQPPPGSKAPKTTDFVPGGQPQAGSKAPKTTDFVLGRQPANPHPELSAPATTVTDTSDKGAKNLPVQRDLGDR